MYAYIEGKLSYTGDNFAVIDCGGVGYLVSTTPKVISSGTIGQTLRLYTHLVVKEDDMSLYGFETSEDHAMFLRLISISGIGPKVGLAVLSAMSANEIASAVLSGDAKAFSRVNGVGGKTAERIVLELKDKKLSVIGTSYSANPVNEAIEALIGLGYRASDASAAVSSVSALADSAEDLMLLALKKLAR